MSDTEREAFDKWFRTERALGWDENRGAWVAWEERARRSTTTEARAPMSDDDIDRLWLYRGSAHLTEPMLERRAFARSVLAARAPAPPSDVQVDVKGGGPKKSWPVERVIEHLNKSACLIGPGGMYGMTQAELRDIAGRLAGPPAPSVPSVSVDETEAKASAVRRPAKGDGA